MGDILETAKMLILEQQRSDSSGETSDIFERFQDLESKINRILSLINKSEE